MELEALEGRACCNDLRAMPIPPSPLLCSWYLETHAATLDACPELAARKHPHLGWAGLISFPHFFAHAFGEYGSPQVGNAPPRAVRASFAVLLFCSHRIDDCWNMLPKATLLL